MPTSKAAGTAVSRLLLSFRKAPTQLPRIAGLAAKDRLSGTPFPVSASCPLNHQRRHQLAPRHAGFPLPSPGIHHVRNYHSDDHEAPAGTFSKVEREILAAAYTHVPEHGFSAAALGLGARDAGYLDISTSVLPDGAFSLIRWHLVTKREALAAENAQMGEAGSDTSVRARVETLTWGRLLGNSGVVRRWQEALAIMAQPSYVTASLKELALLADEICYLAGDKSVDPSWYIKRASLSAIYASAELFMTNDHSAGFKDTHAFLHRRLEEAYELGTSARSVGEWVSFVAIAGVNVLRSKGIRI